jgi:hypothetical protein
MTLRNGVSGANFDAVVWSDTPLDNHAPSNHPILLDKGAIRIENCLTLRLMLLYIASYIDILYYAL